MVSIGTEGPSCLLVSPLVVLWGEAALGREALLSAFLVGAGSPVRELMVKVTVPPPTSTPHSAFTYTSTGKPGSGGSTVQHPAGATFGRAAGLVEAVTTWSPGTPLSSLSRGTWYRAVGRLPLGASKNRKLGHEDLQSGPRKPSRPLETCAGFLLRPPWSLGPTSVQEEKDTFLAIKEGTFQAAQRNLSASWEEGKFLL